MDSGNGRFIEFDKMEDLEQLRQQYPSSLFNEAQIIERRITMPKSKIIKLTKSDRAELDRLQRLETVARHGVATANRLHYEAAEEFWEAVWRLYPELKGIRLFYSKGILTYTPKGEGGVIK